MQLQPMARSETRTTKLYKDRAAEAIARQIVAFSKADKLDFIKLGPDSRVRWADPSQKPTLQDRQNLLHYIGHYEAQV